MHTSKYIYEEGIEASSVEISIFDAVHKLVAKVACVEKNLNKNFKSVSLMSVIYHLHGRLQKQNTICPPFPFNVLSSIDHSIISSCHCKLCLKMFLQEALLVPGGLIRTRQVVSVSPCAGVCFTLLFVAVARAVYTPHTPQPTFTLQKDYDNWYIGPLPAPPCPPSMKLANAKEWHEIVRFNNSTVPRVPFLPGAAQKMRSGDQSTCNTATPQQTIVQQVESFGKSG